MTRPAAEAVFAGTSSAFYSRQTQLRSSMPLSTQRQSNLDAVRVISCVAVVLLHLAATIVMDPRYVGQLSWHVHNLLDAATRWCVPVFVMLSGSLLLTPQKLSDPVDFAGRRWQRIGPPLIFWSTVYFLWRGLFWKESLSLESMLHDVVIGRPFIHLYFLFLILGLYTVTPWLVLAMQRMTQTQLRQGIVVMFCLAVAANAVDFLGTSVFTLFVPYIPYYLLGGYCARYASGSNHRWLVLAIAISMVTSLTAALVWVGGLNWRWAFYFYTDFSPTVIAMAISVFLVITQVPLPAAVARLMTTLAPFSFGIYVAHPFIVELLRYAYYRQMPVLLEPLFYVPVTLPLTLTATLALVALLARVPGLRRVV
jgi:surface polysaccharide O-acyltransferase-like enzyme